MGQGENEQQTGLPEPIGGRLVADALVDAAPDAILIVDQHARIAFANAAAEQLFGYTRAELLDSPLELLVPERQRAKHALHRARYFAAPRTRPMGAGLELTARRKDGSEIAVEISLSPIASNLTAPSEGAGPHSMTDAFLITAFVRDVRERRALWDELRVREVQLAEERATLSAAQRLAAVVDSSDDAIISKTLDGTVTAWNSGAEALYGYTAQEIVGQPIQQIAPPDRSDEVAEILAALRNGKGVTHLETVRRRKDGTPIDVSITVSPIRDPEGLVTGGAVVARDVSAERRALEAQQRSAGQFARILALSTQVATALTVAEVAAVALREGVAAVGASAGNVVLVSPDGQWLEMVAAIGYSHEAVEPWRRFPITTPVAIADAVRSGAPVWLGSAESFAREYPHRTSVASSLSHAAHAALPLTYQGRTIGALGVSFGSPQPFAETDRMFLQILAQVCANNLARAQLFEAERGARAAAEEARQQRDLFIAVAGHELRQPLSALRGYAQLALRRLHGARQRDEQLINALEAIENQTERTARLIGSLLDLGRIQAGSMRLEITEADLRQIIDRVATGMERSTKAHGITVRGPDTLVVPVDVTRIEQVLTNLLDNAIRYSPSNRDISVELEQLNAQTVRVVVRDQGPGIPPARLPHIFEPYYQADQRATARGLGLGLYICREIVLRHGGRIEATCPEDGGTCITVTLPAIAGERLAQ